MWWLLKPGLQTLAGRGSNAPKCYRTIAALADQISREFNVSRQVIDLEMRHEILHSARAFPALLVTGKTEGEVGRMEVRDWLKPTSNNGTKPVKQIVLADDWFDVMSMRQWRERVLAARQKKSVG